MVGHDKRRSRQLGGCWREAAFVRDPDLVIGTEQCEGITPERLQEINVQILHPETLPTFS